MAEIKFENVEKDFGSVRVVKGLNLTIRDGEFFTFVGPSGCGKSTILNMIAGLVEASRGSICFDGRCVNQLSPKDRDVAMVFQSYALYPHLRVYDNIAFPLKMKKIAVDQINEEVNRVAALLGINALLHRKPRELSGGERQRVALARAIIRKPRVFLMDEPLSNLDAKLRVQMRAELKKLHQELKITIVYVTHDQEEAMSLSGRIAVLYGGEVQQHGAPEEVYHRAQTIFVAGFIGSPPMNFIQTKVVGENPLELEVNGTRFKGHTDDAPLGDKAVLGIRPEDIKVSAQDGDYQARVMVMEFAGAGYWVDLDWQGVTVKGFTSVAEEIKQGALSYFNIPIERCCFFDAQSKKRLYVIVNK